MRTIPERKMIFCIDCRWLVHEFMVAHHCKDNLLENMDYDCRYPSNVTIKNSWLCSSEIYMKKPSEINRANNCEWFGPKYKESQKACR